MAPVGEVEFVNGIAAMSASGNYGPCRVAEAIIGHADLTLGARVRDVLEAQIAVGGGRFRGIRYGVSWDASEAISKFVSRVVPPHLVRDAEIPRRLRTARQARPELRILAVSSATARRDRSRTRLPRHDHHPEPCRRRTRRRALSPAAAQEILAGWKKDIGELAKCPNVNVKLGGIGMTSFGFDFHERDVPPSSEELAAAWRQYIEPCIEAFGPDRCMFESNFPPDKQSCGYTELWNAFKRITAGASAAEKKALYSGTAARVYRLTDALTLRCRRDRCAAGAGRSPARRSCRSSPPRRSASAPAGSCRSPPGSSRSGS